MTSVRQRISIALVGAAAALALLPASGSAATVFGNPFKNHPIFAPCQEQGVCTVVSYVQPTADTGDPYTGGAPVGGVITSIRYLAYASGGNGELTFRTAEVSLPNPGDDSSAVAETIGTGPTVKLSDDGNQEPPVKEVAARLPIKKGQQLAVDASENVSVVYNNGGHSDSYIFDPRLTDGAGKKASTTDTGELLVQATIEPDADGDGYGDETQDQCPRQASTQGACDDTKPAVSGFSVRKGTGSYTLSEGATVSFQLSKKLPGRKSGNKCVKQTKANAKKKRCLLLRPQGPEFVGPGASGANSVALPNGKKLKPGKYRLTIVAKDQAGNVGTTTTDFSVVKKKKAKKK